MFPTTLRAEGRILAERCRRLAIARAYVLAIPRDGVLVGDGLAQELGAPLDVLPTTTIVDDAGAPVGALALDGPSLWDDDALVVDVSTRERWAAQARARVTAAAPRMRGRRPPPDLDGHTIVLVDDAIVTGRTLRAALAALPPALVRRAVVATPRCAREAIDRVEPLVRALVALEILPASIAARLHADERRHPCPPLADAEIDAMLTSA